MEGVLHEAASLAAHWRLSRLIAFYDSNNVTIDGPASLAMSEDLPARFGSLGWHVQRVPAHDASCLPSLRAAIQAAQEEKSRPSLIQVRACVNGALPPSTLPPLSPSPPAHS